MPKHRQIVVGITGASGACYAKRLLQLLLHNQCDVHLVISPMGHRLIRDELGIESADLTAWCQGDLESNLTSQFTIYNYRDVGAAIASGSFKHDGMAVVPCSSNTLSAIATGSAQNLIHRAAHVCLKERRKLVLVHRETPLSLVDIRNMTAVTEAGGILCPANPGFYMLPQTIDDLVDFVVARVLDLLEVEHRLPMRWTKDHPAPNHPTQASPASSLKPQ